jgi:hypothetical protein
MKKRTILIILCLHRTAKVDQFIFQISSSQNNHNNSHSHSPIESRHKIATCLLKQLLKEIFLHHRNSKTTSNSSCFCRKIMDTNLRSFEEEEEEEEIKSFIKIFFISVN